MDGWYQSFYRLGRVCGREKDVEKQERMKMNERYGSFNINQSIKVTFKSNYMKQINTKHLIINNK